MAASATFLQAWRRSGREGRALVKVELTRPSARTLYLATAETVTPGPQLWEAAALLEVGTVVAPGSFGARDLAPCSGSFKIDGNGRFAYQTGIDRAREAFADYDWHGAAVTLYLWEESLLALAEPPLPVLMAKVETWSMKDGVVTVSLLQGFDDRFVPVDTVTPELFPWAADTARGRPLPICYGSLKAVPLRSPPFSAEFGNIAQGHNALQLLAGGRRGIPGLVVSMGRGGDASTNQATRVLFAGHQCKTFGDDTNGCAIWMEQGGKLCRTQPGAQVNNCRCSSGVAQVTRPTGDFAADGVHPGSLLANAIATKFPASTRVTAVTAATLSTSLAATATASVDTVGEFLDLENGSSGAALLLADRPVGGTDPFTVFVPILPSTVELVSSANAENPRKILDPFNDTNYVTLDYTNSYRELRARFPTVEASGDIVQADLEMLVEVVSGALTNVKMRVDCGGSNFAEITVPTPSPNPGGVGMGIGIGTPPAWGTGGLPSTPWQFGDAIVRVYFSAAAGGVVLRLYSLGLTIRVRPTREVVAQRTALVPTLVEKREKAPWFVVGWNKQYVYTTTEERPALVPVFGSLLGPFAANLEGHQDDGSGTFTGVAAALVQRAPDIVRHLLSTYGGLGAGDFETGTSTFGSLVDLRAALKTWRQLDMIYGFALLDQVLLSQVVASLAGDSLAWFYRNRFDGKFHGIAWRPGVAPDYARAIPKEWVGAGRIDVEMAPASEVAVSARVPYGMDYQGKTQLFEVAVGPDRSASGHRWRALRDQLMTVYSSAPNENDKLDLAALNVTLDAGDYTPINLAQNAATKLNGGGEKYKVAYGPTIVAGYNDTLCVDTGGGEITATIAAAAYATMEALATAVATALNAASTLWSCSFDRSTLRFTIARSSGTATLKFNTVNVAKVRAIVTLGFDPIQMNGGPHLAQHQREEQRFAIGSVQNSTGQFVIKWETGTNGLLSGLKNCAVLFGFDTARDTPSDYSHLAHSPKGNRETACRAVRDQLGAKTPWTADGATIQDTDTALELVHRAIDLFGIARALIRFRSSYLPDLERGRVIEFEAGADDLATWPGSIAGKCFQVVEVQQEMMTVSLDAHIVAVRVS